MSGDQSIPIEAQNLLKEGDRHYHGDPPDYAAAERCFRKATEIAPDSGHSFHSLGGALERQNKLVEACEAERTAIRLLPGDPRPLIALGWYLHLSGRSAEAVPFLEDGLRLKPHYTEADARYMLAEALEHLGQIDKAADLWRQILKMDSMYPSYDRPMEEAKKKLAKHGLSESA
jgi:protein O-GlcNAc transferase